MKYVLTLFFIFSQANSDLLYTQSTNFINGKIINSITFKPVPFAAIRLKNNQLSVYSNADGDFKVSEDIEFQDDSLLIACIGYKQTSFAFKDLNENAVNKIFLSPADNGPVEVKVVASGEKLTSLSIIEKAIRNIKNNYLFKPYSYISYYRDYQKEDSNYINLNEAIIQTFDSGFASRSVSNINRLLDFRKNPDFPRMSCSPASKLPDSTNLNIPDELIPDVVTRDQYGNELLTLMANDPIRNFNTRSFSFIDTFSENFIYNHNFSPPSEINYNNLLLYKITFNGKTGIIGDSLLVSGSIYVQPKDYSIHKLEYSCYDYNKGKGLKKLYNLEVEYGHDNTTDSLMCLKYISFNKLYNVINMDDGSYFRLQYIRWNFYSNINPTLILCFNNKVDPASASQKENITIMVGNKEIKIKTVQVAGEYLFIRFKNDDIKELSDSLQIYARVLKDINGNILNKRKSKEIYQYRELFVQKFIQPFSLQEGSFTQYLHTEKDSISNTLGKGKYWMNTPVIIPINK